MITRLVLTATLVLLPLAVLLFLFSFVSCDVRMRTEKRGCRAGTAAECVTVGVFYEGKGGGPISFLMSYSDLALSYYHRACKLESAAGCEHMVAVFEHGAEAARNPSTSLTEMADALIESCAASVKGA